MGSNACCWLGTAWVAWSRAVSCCATRPKPVVRHSAVRVDLQSLGRRAVSRRRRKHAPSVVRVWYDMAPGSAYLRELFYSDPDRMTASFTAERDDPPSAVRVSAQQPFVRRIRRQHRKRRQPIYWPAQQDAARLYGFNATTKVSWRPPRSRSSLTACWPKQCGQVQ